MQLDDAALTELALAADPNQPLDEDAIPVFDYLGGRPADGLLPGWYMPAPVSPVPTGAAHRGWRSAVILVVILAFVVIEAAGLCSTYGRIVLG